MAAACAKTLRQSLMVLRHPNEGMYELKYDGTWAAVPILLVLAVIARLISIEFSAYEFTTVEPENTNLILELAKVIVPWGTWVIACYGVSSIFYGEATFKNVAVASAYALLPYALFQAEYSYIFSHILSLDEKALFYLGEAIITWWMLLLFFLQLKTIHDFTLGKCVLVAAVSVLGMIVIWVLAALTYLLTLQMIQFFIQVGYEFITRGP